MSEGAPTPDGGVFVPRRSGEKSVLIIRFVG
jgi:hypothetical protein